LINPNLPPRWDPHPYPYGTAAHVAIPLIGLQLAEGQLFEKTFTPGKIITLGRAINVLYGTATILLVFLFTRRLFRDQRIALIAAWIFALGGLHVSQSHFFVADVPGLFWFLLGSFLLFLEIDRSYKNFSPFLMGAAFSLGVAFGIKLVIVSLPTLAIIALIRRPRIIRAFYSVVFFLTGYISVNLASFTAYDLFKAFTKGVSDPYLWSPLSNVFLYLIELPSLISFPILLLSIGGGYFLARKYFSSRDRMDFWPIMLIVILPLVINAFFVVFKYDHFLRHLIPFIPWISILAAWSLVTLSDKLTSRKITPFFLIMPVFVYLALFVFDGERVFIQEPRNEAARWILNNITPGTPIYWTYHNWFKGYQFTDFPEMGRPPVLAIEMHFANHILSGMSWKNSYPNDYRYIFNSGSQARVDAFQSLFKGTSEYKEVARFSEGYYMPEYVLVNNLIGNRSRNYVAEIVIFMKKSGIDVSR